MGFGCLSAGKRRAEVGALLGSGFLGENPRNESPCHPNSTTACPAGAEEQGNASATKNDEVKGVIDLSPEWKRLGTDYGIGITFLGWIWRGWRLLAVLGKESKPPE